MRTVDRWRPTRGDGGFLADELCEDPVYHQYCPFANGNMAIRRDDSCWRPAFIVAAACNEMEADRGSAGGGGDSARGSDAPSPLLAILLEDARGRVVVTESDWT